MLEECHSLVKHGGGGYSWNDVYNMPVNFRRFVIGLILQENEMQKARQEAQTAKVKSNKKHKRK